MDNGPELSTKAVFGRPRWTGVELRFIELRKPMQNGSVASFYGRFLDEGLNEEGFLSRPMPRA